MKKKELTIIIKTFNRKKSLIRLLNSIIGMKYNYPIIILDDGKNPSELITKKFENLDIEYLCTEFDIGLSKGRNILLNQVCTEYFFLCDDDFVFDERTNLNYNLDIMIQNPQIDILGGITYTRNSINSIFSLITTIRHPNRLKYILKKKEIIEINNGYINTDDNNNVTIEFDKDINNFNDDKLYSVDICMNVFIGKTKRIRDINGWQPDNVKVGEHKTFFIRAKQRGLVVKFTKKLGVQHYPKKTLLYNKYRLRSFYMEKEAFKYHGFNSVTVYDGVKYETIYKKDGY